jgi:hypothetical protein
MTSSLMQILRAALALVVAQVKVDARRVFVFVMKVFLDPLARTQHVQTVAETMALAEEACVYVKVVGWASVVKCGTQRFSRRTARPLTFKPKELITTVGHLKENQCPLAKLHSNMLQNRRKKLLRLLTAFKNWLAKLVRKFV